MELYIDHLKAKELSKYFKFLLQNLEEIIKSKSTIDSVLRHQARIVFDNESLNQVITNEINDLKPIENEDIQSLVLKIVNFKDYSVIYNAAKFFITEYRFEIENDVDDLIHGTNSFRWFFTSRKKKSDAIDSFENLINLKENLYERTEMLFRNYRFLLSRSFYDIKNQFNENKAGYGDYAREKSSSIFQTDRKVSIFKHVFNNYECIHKKIENIENDIKHSIDLVKKSVEKLTAFELVATLKNIPIEELSKQKSGLKIKCLKDGGFLNLADVYAATPYEIASCYGISEDAAYSIKRITEDLAKKASKNIKIKLSVDEKNKYSSEVVRAIYSYIGFEIIEASLKELSKNYGNKLKSSLKLIDKVGNGLNWLFYDDNEKEKVKSAYLYCFKVIKNEYETAVNKIVEDYKLLKADDGKYWDDFAQNPIKYFNIIEQICPGVLGNDDSIYGLPEELAREIQGECFFPDGLLCNLRRYQEWGVKYILHQNNVLLGDEMGLGKTIQAIAAMVSLRNTGGTHFLVVCPASVVTNWCREINKHSKLKAIKCHGSGKVSSFKSWIKNGGVAVTNYESTAALQMPEDFVFEMMIVDEAHYIKNENAKRSVNTIALGSHANRLLYMTGTALENNVDEMISLINNLNPKVASYARGMAFLASASQFREKIAPVYYRRKREDVLTELPDKIESKEWCSLNKEEENVYENAILNGRYSEARRVSWNIDDIKFSSKANRLKEIVEMAEQEGRKVLVFSFFLDTISKLWNFLRGKCLNPITGSVNVIRRQEIIDEFNAAPAGTVLLAQITSGGTGLNIQSASVVVICEPQFKPSIENQAISRAYRMGQSRNVLVYRLLCENTIDEKITELLEEKQEIFNAFADKSVAAQNALELDDKAFGNIIKEEIERINKKRFSDNEASRTKTENASETKDDVQSNPKQFIDCTVNIDELDYQIKQESNLMDNWDNNDKYYEFLMTKSYYELVSYLLDKYGPAKCDYFTNDLYTSRNKNVSRTSEGLYCHHIDEDKAIMLCNDKYASRNPFSYQKAERLVYCNFLEHFLLHILIAENPKNMNANIHEIQGIGGAVNFMCHQLNDLYNGYEFKKDWMKRVAAEVSGDRASYIKMLNRLWNLVKSNKKWTSIISKKELSLGWDGTFYKNIYDELD